MTRSAHRLPRWLRRCLDACAIATLGTGLAWLAVHYTIGAGRGELPHPAEAWLMRAHGLAAFAALFVLGALSAVHVPPGWRLSGRHRWAGQRGTGITLCVCAVAIALTGYLLYYFAVETTRPAIGWVHAILGLAMAGAALLHVARTSRSHGVHVTDNRSHLR